DGIRFLLLVVGKACGAIRCHKASKPGYCIAGIREAAGEAGGIGDLSQTRTPVDIKISGASAWVSDSRERQPVPGCEGIGICVSVGSPIGIHHVLDMVTIKVRLEFSNVLI